MSKRGENIYKRKDGRWEGRFVKGRLDGKTRYGYVYGGTYKEVKDKLSEIAKEKAELLERELCAKEGMPEDGFAALAGEWLDSLKPQLKESSAVKYENILNAHLLPEFRKRRMQDMTRNDVTEFSRRLLSCGGKQGRGLSPKTVTCIIAVLKSICAYAAQERDCAVPDAAGISIKLPQKPVRVLSRAEQQKLGAYLRGDLTPCNLGILLCLYTGMRVGEICALKWEAVCLDEQYLRVSQTMQRLQKTEDGRKRTVITVSPPKSDCSVRNIPIPKEIFQLVAGAKRPDDAYFLTGRANKYVEPRTMQNRFKAVAEKCGIEGAHFHALRHTFATRCVELGFDIKSLSEILGHSSVNITLNRYVHPSMELKRENMNRLCDMAGC